MFLFAAYDFPEDEARPAEYRKALDELHETKEKSGR